MITEQVQAGLAEYFWDGVRIYIRMRFFRGLDAKHKILILTPYIDMHYQYTQAWCRCYCSSQSLHGPLRIRALSFV